MVAAGRKCDRRCDKVTAHLASGGHISGDWFSDSPILKVSDIHMKPIFLYVDWRSFSWYSLWTEKNNILVLWLRSLLCSSLILFHFFLSYFSFSFCCHHSFPLSLFCPCFPPSLQSCCPRIGQAAGGGGKIIEDIIKRLMKRSVCVRHHIKTKSMQTGLIVTLIFIQTNTHSGLRVWPYTVELNISLA